MNNVAQKICSICGETFGCGAKNAAGCWCEDLPRVEIDEGRDCCCPKCLARIAEEQKRTSQDTSASPQLIEGLDYYLEGTAFVFTASYHVRRGYCCDNGCRHCPYSALESTKRPTLIPIRVRLR